SEISCCREPVLFNFEEAGLGWIIAPTGFYTSECAGSCHAHNGVRTSSGMTIEHSCRPNNRKPLSVLYITKSLNIRLGLLPGIVVMDCSC
ncbi:hypothetical protein LOTGIDRAFT_99310, partial [Lottia gigantea]